MSAATPRIATQYPPHTQERPPQQPMPGQRLTRVVRTSGAEAARGSKKRAQAILVKLDETNNYPRHRCN